MKKSTKIVLGSVAGVVLIAGISSAAGGSDEKTASPAVVSTDKPGAKANDKPKAPAKKETPIKLSGVVVPFKAGILSDGGKHTAVRVTIANDSDQDISVNPLYFTITDTNGTKHAAELGEMSDGALHAIHVAPGENTSGIITGEGDFQPKYVTFTENGFGESLRGNVK